ncbi:MULTISPECIES: hypothetical protein [unclassified Mesotoga]|uniref:hypothetical protein n=1 Tax=unclassified Mesotoga TaxID=1184398 RepID=UPI000DA6951E|nr:MULTISPECIES: hypothetical protein [unclassified Mesotoga]PZC52485.1 hypothetical protein LH53_04345 [Mesotoga sp. TolDC]
MPREKFGGRLIYWKTGPHSHTRNVPVVLFYESWDHVIGGHDEMYGREYEIMDVIDNPDKKAESWNPNANVYIKVNRTENLVISVVVDFEHEDFGYVKTAYGDDYYENDD